VTASPAPPAPVDAPLLSRKSRLRYIWILGVALYVIVVWYLGWRRIGNAIASVDPAMLAALVAMLGLALAVRAMKWRLVLGPGRNALGLFFLAKAAGGSSPGRVGELAPLLLRKHRTPRMGAWIVTDRLLEMAATLGLGLAGLLVLQVPNRGAMVVTVAFALILLVVAPFCLLTRQGLFLRVAGRLREGSALMRAATLLATVSGEVRLLRKTVPLVTAVTVLATCLDIGIGRTLYLCFGYSVPFALLAVVQCAHALASAFPFTPNATGLPYLLAAGLLYEMAGLPTDVLAASVGVSLAATAVVFWTAFLLGIRDLRTLSAAPEDQASLFDFLVSGARLYAYKPESLARLNALATDKGRVLDLGCGDGAVGQALDAASVVGVDISRRCVALAVGRGLDGVVADARSPLPFCAASFDTIYCVDVLHHLPGLLGPTLSELDRLLRPGGTMVIVEPDAQYAFVRWTQAPGSPIRVAPCANEPALYAADVLPHIERRGYTTECQPIRIVGDQVERSVFPLWQRLMKAPLVIALAWLHGRRPNKFAIVARKPSR